MVSNQFNSLSVRRLDHPSHISDEVWDGTMEIWSRIEKVQILAKASSYEEALRLMSTMKDVVFVDAL